MAVVLAGGLARQVWAARRDKCLKLLADRPILAHVLERLDGQVERILLNANEAILRVSRSGRVPVAGRCGSGVRRPARRRADGA